MTRAAAEEVHLTDPELQVLQAIKKEGLPGEGLSKSAKKRRREKEKLEERKRAADSWNSAASWKGGGKGKESKGGGGHPRKQVGQGVPDRS